jgi:uncharacterized membrane protein
MRKILEFVSLAALAVIVWITAEAFVGPHRLTGRIPVHFNAAGQPDRWGSPASFLAVPILALVLYVLMTVVARYPSAFNFPVRVSPANRRQLEALALQMISWLKAEVLCLFAGVQAMTVTSARGGEAHLSLWFMPITLVVVFATIGWYVAGMLKAGKRLGAK